MCKQNHLNYQELLSTIVDLDEVISYKNSSGQSFENSVRDILTHVALHGHYHRGQINSRLRVEGAEPVPVDYIFYKR